MYSSLRGTHRAQDVFRRLTAAGWTNVRISGSHHIFTRGGRCLPVAVHSGKLRRDVVRHVLRQAGLDETDGESIDIKPGATAAASAAEEAARLAACEAAPATAPGEAGAEAASATAAGEIAPSMCKRPAERKWAETTEEEQAFIRARAQQGELAVRKDYDAFRALLDTVQIDLLHGRLEDADAALTPILGVEREWQQLCTRYNFDLVSEALFFLAAARTGLATAGGSAAFSQAAKQQLIVRAFTVCKRLMLAFKERRDDAQRLLSELLAWMFSTYVNEMLQLSLRAGQQEFPQIQVRAMRQLIRVRGVPREGIDSASPAFCKAAGEVAETMREAALVGWRVCVVGLEGATKYNGRHGLVDQYHGERGRYSVRLDCVEKPLLVRRFNLQRLPGGEPPGYDEREWAPSAEEDEATERHGPMGQNSDLLDEIRAHLGTGFTFITGLARAESSLLRQASASADWPLQGLVSLSRGTITQYERGALVSSCETFEAILQIAKDHAGSFARAAQTHTASLEGSFPTMFEAASAMPQTMDVVTSLAQACLRMRPAHEHAMQALSWARGLGFGDTLQPDGVTVKPAIRCWSSVASPRIQGWLSTIETARREGAVSRPMHWPSLCEFMRLFFEGMEFCVEHQMALSVGAGLLFLVQNLHDPIMMVEHQLSALRHCCEPLRAACQARARDGAELRLDESPNDETLLRSAHKPVRLQLITLMRWLVRLNGLVYRLDTSIAKQVKTGDTKAVLPVICSWMKSAVEHIREMTEACCVTVDRPRSTLIDLHDGSLMLWTDLTRCEYSPGQKPVPGEYFVGKFASMSLASSLPEYLQWFALAEERKPLAILYGLVTNALGFNPGNSPTMLEDQRKKQLCTHDGRFCAYSLQMLELLRVLQARRLTWESFADAVLELMRRGGRQPAALGAGSGRKIRRSDEVQRIARRHFLLVTQTLAARFTTADIEDFSARRRCSYDALLTTLKKVLKALRAATPPGGGQVSPNGGVYMSRETFDRVGAELKWTRRHVHEIDEHVDSLTALAAEVNRRVCAAFGGNFPALVWQSDVFEYEIHVDEREHQIDLLEDNTDRLEECVRLMEIIATGAAPPGGPA